MNWTSNTIGRHIAMRYEQAVSEFKSLLNNGEYDYWTIQLMWTEFVDGLCREGRITQKQFDNWSCPYEYGKHVVVYDRRVVTQR